MVFRPGHIMYSDDLNDKRLRDRKAKGTKSEVSLLYTFTICCLFWDDLLTPR